MPRSRAVRGGHQEVPVTAGSLVQLESHNSRPKGASPQPLPGPRHPGQEGKEPRSGPSSREYLEQTALLLQLTLPVLGCPTRRGPWSARCVHTPQEPSGPPSPLPAPSGCPARSPCQPLPAAAPEPCLHPGFPRRPRSRLCLGVFRSHPPGPLPTLHLSQTEELGNPAPQHTALQRAGPALAAGGVISHAGPWPAAGVHGAGERRYTQRETGSFTRAWTQQSRPTRQARHPQPPGEGEMPPSGSILRPRA